MSENKYRSDRNKRNEDGSEIRDLDTLLAEEIGQFGWHQFRTTAIVLIFILLSAIKYDVFITTARIATRCFVPECENDIENAKFRPTWISNAIPKSHNDTYDNCHRFAPNESLHSNASEMCLPGQFDHQQLIECENYVYENHNTVVYDFDLGCQEWRRAFIGTLQSSAYFIGIPLTGFISDRWGRRVAFTLNVFFYSVLGMARYWSYTFNSYLILGFIMYILDAGFFPSGYILAMETVGTKYRVLVGVLVFGIQALAQVLIGAVAWLVPQWRDLTLIMYPPALIIIFFWHCYPDSPRWYYSKNRFEKAETIIKDMAKMNKKNISKEILNNLRKKAEEELKQEELQKQEMKSEPWLPVLVFQHKPILLRCCITPIWWFSFIIIHYGLGFNSVYLSGNQYLSMMAINAIEIPGYIMSIFLMDRIGRKAVLMGTNFLCAVSQIVYLFVPKENFVVSLTLYLFGKLCSAIIMQAVYLYTAELYPTKYRHRLFAFSSLIGRFGNLIAPLTPAFGDVIPYILNATFALLSGFLTLFTPETLGRKLADTLEEACDMKSTISKKDKHTA